MWHKALDIKASTHAVCGELLLLPLIPWDTPSDSFLPVPKALLSQQPESMHSLVKAVSGCCAHGNSRIYVWFLGGGPRNFRGLWGTQPEGHCCFTSAAVKADGLLPLLALSHPDPTLLISGESLLM